MQSFDPIQDLKNFDMRNGVTCKKMVPANLDKIISEDTIYAS